jgi:hypothetical protein
MSRSSRDAVAHHRPRYWCTSWTAIAPSPTAEATRFTDREQTSPAANTPGRLVSRGKGSRCYRHVFGRASSGPVSTKPWESRATEAPSQSVCGRAPMQMYRPAGRFSRLPLLSTIPT